MSTGSTSLEKVAFLYNIEQKNARATKIIEGYASTNTKMNIGVGLASWLPFAALPAIAASLALQINVIYKPMAQELAEVYTANPDQYTDRLGMVASVTDTTATFASEFALEFLTDQAFDLVTEVGAGFLATFIPFAGMAAGAALDYLISQKLTWRVGTMSAIYFQNCGEWVGNRQKTLSIAKDLAGGLGRGMSQAFDSKGSADNRVNFNEIPSKVPEVLQTGVRNILPLIKAFADKLPRPLVREGLIAMGLSALIVDPALTAYYAQV
jgi:hypothetical protein